jgi:hypothetical protein
MQRHTCERCGPEVAICHASLNSTTHNDPRNPGKLVCIQPCPRDLEKFLRTLDTRTHKPNRLPCSSQIVVGTWMSPLEIGPGRGSHPAETSSQSMHFQCHFRSHADVIWRTSSSETPVGPSTRPTTRNFRYLLIASLLLLLLGWANNALHASTHKRLRDLNPKGPAPHHEVPSATIQSCSGTSPTRRVRSARVICSGEARAVPRRLHDVKLCTHQPDR